jgi:hypothetical protein
MIAREGFAFEHDLVLPVDVRLVKGRHEQVEVGCQCLHDSHLRLGGSHDGDDKFGGSIIGVEPGWEW